MSFGPRVPQKQIKRGEKVSAVVLCTTARLFHRTIKRRGLPFPNADNAYTR